MLPRVYDLAAFLEGLAPARYALPEDNVGLLVGSAEGEVSRVLVTLDVSDGAVGEALGGGYDLIVSHHPAVFKPLFRLVRENAAQNRLIRLLEGGVSVLSLHTNLDAARGGVNDALADALCLTGVKDFENYDAREGVPSIGRLGLVEPCALDDFARFAGERLGCRAVSFARATGRVRRVAVAGGACPDYLADAARAGADTLVTSDVKYKHFTAAADAGVNLIDCGHYPTENVVVAPLAEKIGRAFPGVTVRVSQKNVNCVETVFIGHDGSGT